MNAPAEENTGPFLPGQYMTQRYRQNPAAEAAPLAQGLVVLEPQSRKFCALNGTSSWIWNRLKEPTSAEQLAGDIVVYCQGVTEPIAVQDVRAIIGEMTALGIVIPVVE